MFSQDEYLLPTTSKPLIYLRFLKSYNYTPTIKKLRAEIFLRGAFYIIFGSADPVDPAEGIGPGASLDAGQLIVEHLRERADLVAVDLVFFPVPGKSGARVEPDSMERS